MQMGLKNNVPFSKGKKKRQNHLFQTVQTILWDI